MRRAPPAECPVLAQAPGGVPRTGRPLASARLMVARAKEARPAPVTSELLGLTQPVVLHHVKILVDAGSFARREALRVGVLHTCPLSLGCAGRRGRGRAALPHLAFVCAGAGVTTPEAVMLLARLVERASAGDGPAGLMASRR